MPHCCLRPLQSELINSIRHGFLVDPSVSSSDLHKLFTPEIVHDLWIINWPQISSIQLYFVSIILCILVCMYIYNPAIQESHVTKWPEAGHFPGAFFTDDLYQKLDHVSIEQFYWWQILSSDINKYSCLCWVFISTYRLSDKQIWMHLYVRMHVLTVKSMSTCIFVFLNSLLILILFQNLPHPGSFSVWSHSDGEHISRWNMRKWTPVDFCFLYTHWPCIENSL